MLADDHGLVRAGLRKLLESMSTVEVDVVGEADDGLAALALAARLRPELDLVMMDVAMPLLDGLEATGRLLEAWPEARVLMLSMHDSDEYARRSRRHGAVGYLLKDAAPEELELAVMTVARGDTWFSPGVSPGARRDTVAPARSDVLPAGTLTARQREVLQLIAAGLGSKEIARRLDISLKTVDTHRTQLMKALDIHEVAGLVRYALREGLISVER